MPSLVEIHVWHNGPGDDDFYTTTRYFGYFELFPPGKGHGPLFEVCAKFD